MYPQGSAAEPGERIEGLGLAGSGWGWRRVWGDPQRCMKANVSLEKNKKKREESREGGRQEK